MWWLSGWSLSEWWCQHPGGEGKRYTCGDRDRRIPGGKGMCGEREGMIHSRPQRDETKTLSRTRAPAREADQQP